jgi:uncharacterized protein (DUF58 family)
MAAPRRRAFPLISRRRTTGIAYGTHRSRRRGQGAEIAGTRPYVPGDRLAWIDWYASARASLARNDDVFVVRQYFTEIAPRVVLLVDKRPSMGLYPDDLPWLSKPAVVEEATTAIVAAVRAARAYMGYLDFGHGPDGGPAPNWIPPHRQNARRIMTRVTAEYTAPPDSLELAMDYLLGLRSDVPASSFVFIVSDFLRPLPDELWSRAYARGWDVVPVVVQDPVWEQSFPGLGRVLLPVVDATTGRRGAIRLSAGEAGARREANETRLRDTLDRFRRLGFDPVLLDAPDPQRVDAAFFAWASRRRVVRSRAA